MQAQVPYKTRKYPVRSNFPPIENKEFRAAPPTTETEQVLELPSLPRTMQEHIATEYSKASQKVLDKIGNVRNRENFKKEGQRRKSQYVLTRRPRTSSIYVHSQDNQPEVYRPASSRPTNSPDGKELSGMALEHMRTRGELFGPQAISAIAGNTKVRPHRHKHNDFDRAPPTMMEKVNPAPPTTPPSTVSAEELVWGTSMESSIFSQAGGYEGDNDEFSPIPQRIGYENYLSEFNNIRDRAESSENLFVDKYSTRHDVVMMNKKKFKEHPVAVDQYGSKIKPIGWRPVTNPDESKENDGKPTLRYVFSVPSGKKSFKEQGKDDPKHQRVQEVIQKQNALNKILFQPFKQKKSWGKGSGAKKDPTASSNGKGKKKKRSKNKNLSSRPQSARVLTAKRAPVVLKKNTNRNPTSRRASAISNTESGKFYNRRRRPIGPKIEGVNAVSEIYTNEIPLTDTKTLREWRSTIRTTVLPTPKSHNKPIFDFD